MNGKGRMVEEEAPLPAGHAACRPVHPRSSPASRFRSETRHWLRDAIGISDAEGTLCLWLSRLLYHLSVPSLTPCPHNAACHSTRSGEAVPQRPESGMSGLHGLKRAWSGSAHDLGEDGEDVSIAPTKAQRRMKENILPASSPADYSDGWEMTPPEKQEAIRKSLQGSRTNTLPLNHESEAHNVFRPKIADPDNVEDCLAVTASQRQLPGVRVSGLSRSFTRTTSQDHEAGASLSSSVASSSKLKLPASSSTSSRSDRLDVAPSRSRSNSSEPPAAAGVPQKRQLPPGFQSKPKQQLVEERRRNGQGPSFLSKQPPPPRPASVGPQNPADEYKEKEASVPGMFRLSAQQLRVRNMVVEEGKNVFFTGSAGEWNIVEGAEPESEDC
ncbi:hypothetical protein BCV69DRAFT_155217 [Microstroma glucosiphilum]|uniref:Uncharacterized protein n=1 Tax=Pseudomicrostroma glucosiphilum TaxID=1684307 RepID=A0A316U966_9BASI|nr:hypothetical protein BCV69DRAFT_155217 [Pseudomicrostroma glucosiphilum]PWN21770.1 hypothetical protein BCV69DRAFT_155217 [Pseudomicrostroma glucosiphilum]